ncbi:MAG: response regulator [Pseudomonadales bacterium]|nr:response regulator [Pseudomonadales bacterium]
MDLSKVEAGMLDIYRDRVEVIDLTMDLENRFKPLSDDKKIPLVVDIESGISEFITSDSKRIVQILKNFLSNAFKFSELGDIILKVFTPDLSTVFSQQNLTHGNVMAFAVSDSGIGIPAEKQEAIFEAFQQQDGSTSRKYGGTGLGLTIARHLAVLLQGEITLSSTPNVGSTFTLFLPIETPFEGEVDESGVRQDVTLRVTTHSIAPREKAEIIGSNVHSLSPRLLLIIEDDNKNAYSFKKTAEDNGYQCLMATTGQDGLALAIKYKPMGILLDIGLPDISGLKVLEQLKQDPKTCSIPVHVVSGFDQEQMAIDRGAESYLHKPIEMSDVASALRTLDQVRPIRRVLVIEDDKAQQKAITTLLSGESLALTYAGSGREARAQLKESTFDCVILDLGLPDIDGIDLARQIREHPLAASTPIIVYTARELNDEQYRILDTVTKAIIIKGKNSDERLLDDVQLFLHHVENTKPKEEREGPSLLHDDNAVLKGQRLLLVDDDMRNVFALSKQLKEYGLEISIAANGKAALDKLDAHPFDIVLMDIMMPVMDGYEATQKIRQMNAFKDLPIIALTANAMSDDREKCLAAGASEYMTKPIDIDKLVSMLKVWLYKAR